MSVEKFDYCFDSAVGGALIFSYHFLAVSGNCVSEDRFRQAFVHCLQQVLLVFDHDGTLACEECIDCLLEVEGVWAKDGAFAKGCCFHHVGAAHRHQ